MAALRLGVGDVFTVCKSVVDLCAKVTTSSHEEMKDVRTLVAEMELMREHLGPVSQRLEKNNRAVEKDIAPLMTRSLIPIHTDLLNIHHTLQTHQQRKQSVHVLDQARYMLHYSDKLTAFKESLPRHRESISLIYDIIESDNDEISSLSSKTETNNTSTRTRRDSILKLAGIVERDEVLHESESYDQGWIEEESRLRRSVEQCITEEVEPENDFDLYDANETCLVPCATTPLTYWKTPTLPRSIVWSKPTFNLAIFDTFSCTNTPRSSPPPPSLLETQELEP